MAEHHETGFFGDLLEEAKMKTTLPKLLTVIGLLALVTTAAASADESALNLRSSLSGFNEVPPKATGATGTFKAKASNGAIEFTLTYSGLTTPAFMAHFHFAQRGVNSSIFIWLCGNPGTPAHQVCPAGNTAQPETVTGRITAADILALPDQNLSAGDMAAALRIIEAGDAYVNVHTSKFTGGEIRGQVSSGGSGGD
jgi:CHRD domain